MSILFADVVTNTNFLTVLSCLCKQEAVRDVTGKVVHKAEDAFDQEPVRLEQFDEPPVREDPPVLPALRVHP